MPSHPSIRGWISRAVPLLLLVTAPGCRENAPTSPAALSDISVSPLAATLAVGSVLLLSARARNGAGEPLDSLELFWSTSNSLVASVNGNGLVTARAPGQAQIAATALGHSAVAAIEVRR